MQAIFETAFDAVYLVTVITLGIIMIKRSLCAANSDEAESGDLSHDKRQYLLFGIMAVTLGAGDAFHLVPRAIALCTTGLESYTAALGIEKLITSVTMTAFYVLLYYVWRSRYKVSGKPVITASVWLCAVVRAVLCLMPQNKWTNPDAPLSWGIYRNIPFAVLGGIIVVLFFKSAKIKRQRFPFSLAYRSAKLRLLYPRGTFCRHHSAYRYKMSIKHHRRIRSYAEPTRPFWNFFDLKSYCMMAFMMGGGIWLRYSGLVPELFIAVFYTGLGCALAGAGIMFWVMFFRYNSYCVAE